LTLDGSAASSFNFIFKTALALGQSYDVTVGTQPTGQICTVTNNTGIATAPKGVIVPAPSIEVSCGAGLSIGFTLSGLATGDKITLLDNGTNPATLGTNGRFTLPQVLATGQTYNVTVGTQPAGQVCTVTNGSGTVGKTNVTNVEVNCQNGALIRGTITGLDAGQTVVLLDNGGDALTLDGSAASSFNFIFKTALALGQSYDVTVGTQPTGQICTVTNNTGIATAPKGVIVPAPTIEVYCQ